MKTFAFISRHAPTSDQAKMAEDQDIEMVHIGDTDAFTVTHEWVCEKGVFEGVIIVHPSAALRLCEYFIVGVFENANRAEPGEKPQFEAKALHVYDVRA